MLSNATPQASAYRRTMNLMGWSLLIFLGLFTDLNLLDQMLFAELLTGKVGTAISGLISSAVYMAPFIVGGAMFYVFNRKTPTMPIRYGLKLPATLFNMGVAIIIAPVLSKAIRKALEQNHISLN